MQVTSPKQAIVSGFTAIEQHTGHIQTYLSRA